MMMMTSPRMTRRRLSSIEHNIHNTSSKEEQMHSSALHKIELSSSDDARSDDDDDDEDHQHHEHHDLQDDESKAIARGGVVTPFPWKLHDMLEDAEDEGREHIVSWQAHGRSFMVHQPKDFVSQIMKKYFNQSKFASFQRQLNLYGFRRLTHGKDKGAYWHECFVRGQRSLCKGMIRQKIKGTKVRKTLAPHEEPDFYKQEWALSKKHTPGHSVTMMETTTTTKTKTTTAFTSTTSSTSSSATAGNHKEDLPKAPQLPPLVSPVVGPLVSPGFMDMPTSAPVPMIVITNSDDSAAVITTLSSASSLDDMVEDPYETAHPTPVILPDSHQLCSTTMEEEEEEDDCNYGFIHNSFSMKNIKGGDLLFFEGRPFHYLEHLEGLPQPYPSSSVMSLAAAFCQAQPTTLQQQQLQLRQPPSLTTNSLSRLDLDRLLSYNACSV